MLGHPEQLFRGQLPAGAQGQDIGPGRDALVDLDREVQGFRKDLVDERRQCHLLQTERLGDRFYRVRGWRDAKSLWQEPSTLADLATTGPIGGLNVNTASAKILAAMTLMDERAASRIVASRAASPITDLLDLRALGEGAGGEDHPLVLLPGNIIRLKLSEPGEPLMYVVTIRLTPLGKTPYRVEYAVRLPLDAVARALTAADLPNFPSDGAAP